jgi:hypothetical protein
MIGIKSMLKGQIGLFDRVDGGYDIAIKLLKI